MPWVEKSFGKI